MGASDAMDIETTPCPLCGATGLAPIMPTRDRLCGVPGAFRLVRCTSCELVYLSPRPTRLSIATYYPKGYDPFIASRLEELPVLQRLGVCYGLRRRCRFVLEHRNRGRLLDVGCATGQFLAEMRRFPGWEVAGVEPSAPAAEFARRAYGLQVHHGELQSAGYPDAAFDVVTLWDVLEHLHSPADVLEEIKRILAPDGCLILRTPSLSSWDARVFGRYWAGLDSPRHLAIFSRATITRLLHSSGFEMHHFKTGSGSYFVCLLSWRFWLDEAIANRRLRRALGFLAGNWGARFATALPLAVTDRLGLGSEMTVVARPSHLLHEQSARSGPRSAASRFESQVRAITTP